MQKATQESSLEVHGKYVDAVDLPPFKEFVLHVSDILAGSHENFWKCRDTLASLSRSRAALDYIESQLLNALQSPCYFPRFTLVECGLFTLRLRLVSSRPPASTINTIVGHQMLAMIQGSAQLHRFEHWDGRPDSFGPPRRISSRGICNLSPGDVVGVRAGVECYELSTQTSAILFELHSCPLYRLQRVYDAATLEPKRIFSSDPADMQAELAILTARSLGLSECVPYVQRLLDHPNHFIRRAALRTLVVLDPGNGEAYASVAANDPHPDVQQAVLSFSCRNNNGA